MTDEEVKSRFDLNILISTDGDYTEKDIVSMILGSFNFEKSNFVICISPNKSKEDEG